MFAASLLLSLTLLGSVPQGEIFPEGRSLGRDLGRGLKLVWDDAIAVVTFPAHLEKRDAWLTVGLIAVGGVLFAFDEEIYDMVKRNEDEQPFEAIIDVGEFIEPVGLMGDTWPYYAGTMAVGYAGDWAWPLRVGGEILLAQYSAGALRNLAKLFIGRERPYEEKGAYEFSLDGGTSFPSGHAASIFALSEVLAHHVSWRPFTMAAHGAAACLAYQRISSDAHWPSDVWIGAFSGFGAARLITGRHDRLLGGAQITPSTAPMGEAGFALRWDY